MPTTCVKIFCCVCCAYTSKRKYDLQRHHSVMHKDILLPNHKKSENVVIEEQHDTPASCSAVPHSCKVVPKNNNSAVFPTHENATHADFHCKKCNKAYKSEKYLKNHELNCNRLDSLTCPRCMKSFANRKSKSKHIVRNNCQPRSIIHARVPNPQNIGTQNNNSHNTYNTQNIGTQNNNIYINNFGSERIDHISKEEIQKILMSCENMIPLYIERKHFDKDFPENMNITFTKDNKCLVKEKEKWNERNLNSLSTKLINDNSKSLLVFYDDNIIEIGNHVKDDDIMIRVKDRLVSLYTKSDIAKYKKVLELIKEVIKKSKECSRE